MCFASQEKPLSLYIFTDNKSVRESILNRTSSGSVCVNDVIVHLSIETLPFGGVGNSGYGAYHGKDSFDTFSHRKCEYNLYTNFIIMIEDKLPSQANAKAFSEAGLCKLPSQPT